MDLYTECLSQDGLASYAAGECGMKQDPVRYVITLLTSSLFSGSSHRYEPARWADDTRDLALASWDGDESTDNEHMEVGRRDGIWTAAIGVQVGAFQNNERTACGRKRTALAIGCGNAKGSAI